MIERTVLVGFLLYFTKLVLGGRTECRKCNLIVTKHASSYVNRGLLLIHTRHTKLGSMFQLVGSINGGLLLNRTKSRILNSPCSIWLLGHVPVSGAIPGYKFPDIQKSDIKSIVLWINLKDSLTASRKNGLFRIWWFIKPEIWFGITYCRYLVLSIKFNRVLWSYKAITLEYISAYQLNFKSSVAVKDSDQIHHCSFMINCYPYGNYSRIKYCIFGSKFGSFSSLDSPWNEDH